MADKIIRVGKHRYVIGIMKTGAGDKMYTVQRDNSMSLKLFKKLSDIQYTYPNLKGKLKGI